MMKPAHNSGFNHKKRVIKNGSSGVTNGAHPPERRPEFQLNVNGSKDDERMKEIERRIDRLNRAPQSGSAVGKRKRRSMSKDRGGRDRGRFGDDIEPMLLRQLQELTNRMDQMQSYGSVNNLNLSPRGPNSFASKYGGSPARLSNNGYHSDSDAEPQPQMMRSFPALPGQFGQPPMPLGGMGNGYISDGGLRGYQMPLASSTFDTSPYGRNKISPSYQIERDDIRKSLTQQNMELQAALQDTRNEYLKAMAMLEGETYERQQLERKTGDLTNKLAASRQALAVTQTALSGLQDANQESSRTRDIRDIEIEKYISEIKVKDAKISALESRSKDFDEHLNMNLAKKDETIQKLQKKLTDALDTAYKAENDASTVSKDLSIAEQEVYSLRNRLSHMDLNHQQSIQRLEKEHKNKIEMLNESLNKALSSQDQSEKNVLRSATLEAKNIELEARVRYLDSALVKAEREKSSKDADIAKLQTDLSDLAHEKSLSASSLTLELEDKIRQLEKNANNMKEREASLISEKNGLQSELDVYKKRVAELSDVGANPIIHDLEYAKGLLEKENDHLKRQHQALEQELFATKKTLKSNDEQALDNMKKQITAKEDEIRQLFADLRVAREENANLSKAIGESGNSSSEAAIKTISADRDRLFEANSKLEAELRATTDIQSALEGKLAAQVTETANVRKQLDSKDRALEDLERKLDVTTSELTVLQTKINSNKFVSPTAPGPEDIHSSVTVAPKEVIKAATPSAQVAQPEPEPEASTSAHGEEVSVAEDVDQDGKKKKKKKKKSKSSKGHKSSKSSKSSGGASGDEDDENSVHTNSKISDPVEPIIQVPGSTEAQQPTQQPTPPKTGTPTTPFRRAGFSVPTPEPENQASGERQFSSSNRNVTSATASANPPPSASSNPPGSAPINNIFNVTPSPAVNSRKQMMSSDTLGAGSSAGADREGSAAEKQGYNALRSWTGNSRGTSAASNLSVTDLRQQLMELNNEKKRIKKGISKWNTDFLLNNNREAGVDDKSSDSVITTLYQEYHEVNFVAMYIFVSKLSHEFLFVCVDKFVYQS